MASRFLTILTGRNLPKIVQPRQAEQLPVNEGAVAYFARVLEKMGILKPLGLDGRAELPSVGQVNRPACLIVPDFPTGMLTIRTAY
jgi:hypothetical protein